MQVTSGCDQTLYIILGTCLILSSALAACGRITHSIGFDGEAIGAKADVVEFIESIGGERARAFYQFLPASWLLGSLEVDWYVFSASILSEWIVSLMMRHLQPATGLSI